MTYTTQQLQAMSDFEVNKSLCLKLGYDVSGISEQRNMMTNAVTDYCNSPGDIMPLAFERGIKLDCVACPAGSGFVYYAKSYDGKLQSDYDSACRAIACLILMMED